jgi:hypothetical protein
LNNEEEEENIDVEDQPGNNTCIGKDDGEQEVDKESERTTTKPPVHSPPIRSTPSSV